MPRIVSVSEVRRAIYLAAGGLKSPGPGEASTALLGQLFHETFRSLTGPDPNLNLIRPLERADRSRESWETQLIEHAYLWCVGPQMARYRKDLQGSTREVLAYWTAARNLCGWLVEVLLTQSKPAQAIEEVRRYIFADNELDCQVELKKPDWPDSVILQGRIDAVLRQPGTGQICAVEIKLGQTHPEADLAQACLYQLLLSSREPSKKAEDLALLTFQPEVHERLWKASELSEAREKLQDLIAALAGLTEKEPAIVEPGSRLGRAAGNKLDQMARVLMESFEEFGAPIHLEGEPLVGPAFYRFRAKPARRIKADKILSMANTIWPRLKTDQPPQINLEHGLIVVDVQRPDRERLLWEPGLCPGQAKTPGEISSFPVGLSVENRWKYADLTAAEHTHFLVAGTTGSGKTEWLRMVVGSLLTANTPERLSFVLIDPKRTAFGIMANSPFLRRPIVFPSDEDILSVLDDLVEEMERRFAAMEKNQVNDLGKYNEAQWKPLPRIVCICDEYADLVLADSKKGKEVERRIGRLGAKGRAAGIHLILATQRPSRDVVRGVIKANMNARVALHVNEKLESRIILEQAGAETLLGKGDLFFKDLGTAIRLQAPLISDADLKRAARC